MLKESVKPYQMRNMSNTFGIIPVSIPDPAFVTKKNQNHTHGDPLISVSVKCTPEEWQIWHIPIMIDIIHQRMILHHMSKIDSIKVNDFSGSKLTIFSEVIYDQRII